MLGIVDYTDEWEDTFQLVFYKGTYENGNLYVGAISNESGDWEQYADVTVNLEPVGEYEAYLDTNNAQALCTSLLISGDALLTGDSFRSGYCTYPKVVFNPSFIDSLYEFESIAVYLESDEI